jgi:putative alpha-1,2-mannosidase
MTHLINTLGGDETFVKRLQFLLTTPGLLYLGDEQAFNSPFLFHYAGRPGLSAYFAHDIIPSLFNDTISGVSDLQI